MKEETCEMLQTNVYSLIGNTISIIGYIGYMTYHKKLIKEKNIKKMNI